ncbi:hypothetical protein KO481_40195 [Nocardia sp. NEAU-G5]|uniref:Tox-PL domain-containing protein n=1 Tax=Nocardia albiluteola TaxID=2842303 RepID=A0ABS6BBR5_9NOCA|nr:toxin glutamine deamidase domain-containing protein [Nocardia albiluteola]MBU3067728.1 hypothetical protein [Nocardia albiluteola]
MSIMLPDWAAGIIGVLGGGTWPEADEDALFALGAAWKQAAGDLKALDTDLADAKSAVDVAYPEGKGHDAIVAALDQFVTGNSSFDTLSGFMDQLGDYSDGTGASIEHSKLQILVAAAVTVAMLASAAIPGCQADLPLAWAMLRMALIGILQELFIELIQLEEGHIKSLDGWEIAFSGANMAASELGGRLFGKGFGSLLEKMLAGPIGKAVGEDLLKSFAGKFGQQALIGIAGGTGGLVAGTVAGEAQSTIMRGLTTGDWHLDKPEFSTNMFLNLAVSTGLHSALSEHAPGTTADTTAAPDVPTVTPDVPVPDTGTAPTDAITTDSASPNGIPARSAPTVTEQSGGTANDSGPMIGRSESQVPTVDSDANQNKPPEQAAAEPRTGTLKTAAPGPVRSSPVTSRPVTSDTAPVSDEIPGQPAQPAASIASNSASEIPAPMRDSPISAAPTNETATPIPGPATADETTTPVPASATAAGVLPDASTTGARGSGPSNPQTDLEPLPVANRSTAVPEPSTPALDPVAADTISRIDQPTGNETESQGAAAPAAPQKTQDTGKSQVPASDRVPASKEGARNGRTETVGSKSPNERPTRAVVSADDPAAPRAVDAKPQSEIQARAGTAIEANPADKSFRIGSPVESDDPSHQDLSATPPENPQQLPENSAEQPSDQDRAAIARARGTLATLDRYEGEHPPQIASVRTDPDQPSAYEWRRYPDHPDGPLSVVRIPVDIAVDPSSEPATGDRLEAGLWEKLRSAGDSLFNRGHTLPSGDRFLAELVPATDEGSGAVSLYLTENGEFGTLHEGTTVDDLAQRLHQDLGLEPGSGHGLSEDDLYKFSRAICRVNTDAMLGGLEHIQRLGRYAELEDRGNQYDLEDILRMPGENRFRIGVNPEEYRRLINPGGLAAPGRGDNCVIASLSALATFYGDPTVSVPRAPTVVDGEMTYTGVGDAEWRQIGPWMGNRPWDNFNDGTRTIPEQFDALRARIESAGPGSAALVGWGWKVYDAEQNPLFNPDGTPMVNSGHAIVLVYPHDAQGPVWFDPQSGEIITDPRLPEDVVQEAASLEYVAFEPPGGTPDATGTEHRGTGQSLSDTGIRNDPTLPGDPLRPLLGVPGDAVPGADRPEGTPGPGQLPGGQANRGGHDDSQLDAPTPGGEAVRRVGPDRPAPAGTADLSAPVPGDHPANAGGSEDDRIPGADRIPGPTSGTDQGIPPGDHQDQPGLPTGDATGGERGGLGAVAGPHERNLAGTGDIRGVEPSAEGGGGPLPGASGEQLEPWQRGIGAHGDAEQPTPPPESQPDRPFSLSTTPNGHDVEAAATRPAAVEPPGPSKPGAHPDEGAQRTSRQPDGSDGPVRPRLRPVRLTAFEGEDTNEPAPHAEMPGTLASGESPTSHESGPARLVAARKQAVQEFRAAFRDGAPEETLRELARRAGQALRDEHKLLMDSLNDLPYDDVLRQLDLLDLRDAPLQEQTPVQDVERALSGTGSAPGGRELIIGGGRAFRPLARGELTVNIDPEARPHLKADVAKMDALPTGTSGKAVFENVGLDQLTASAAAQLHRVLEPGGQLVMTTGPRYFAEQGLREAVIRTLENAGFTDIRWEFNEEADIRPFFDRDDEGTILLYSDGEPRLRWVPESPFQVTATKPGSPEASADDSAAPRNAGTTVPDAPARPRLRPVRLTGFDTGDSNQPTRPDAPARPRLRPVRLAPLDAGDSNQPPPVVNPAGGGSGGGDHGPDISELPTRPGGTQDETANAYGQGLRPQGANPNPQGPITVDQITPPQPGGGDEAAQMAGGQQMQQMMLPPEQSQQHAPQQPDMSPNPPVREAVPKIIDPRDLVRQQVILNREQDELNVRDNRRIATEQALADERLAAQNELDRAIRESRDVRNHTARVRAAQDAEQQFRNQADPDLDELRKRVADRQQAVNKALRQTGRPPAGLYDKVASAEAERRALRGQRAGVQTLLDQVKAQIDALRQHGNGADPDVAQRMKELLDQRTQLIGDKIGLDEKWVQANIAVHSLLRFGNDQSGATVDLSSARVIARFELPVSGNDRMQVNFTRQMLDEQVRNGNLSPILPEELRRPISAVRAVLNESGSTPERVRAALDAARSQIDLAARNVPDPRVTAYAHRLINELETGSSLPEQHWWQRAAWRSGVVDSQSVTKTMRVGADIVEAGNGTRYLRFNRLTDMIAYEANRYYFGSGVWDGLSDVLPPVDHELLWHEHFGLGYSASANTAVVEASGRRFEQNVDQRDYFAVKINPLAPGPAFIEQHVNFWPEAESQQDPATFDPALNLHDVDKVTIKNYWAVNPRIFFNHIALADVPLTARIVMDTVFTSTDNGAPTGAVNYSLQLMGSYSVLENLVQKTLPGILGANHITVPPDWALKIPDVGGDSTISLNLNKLFGGGAGAEIPPEMRDALARAGISVDRNGNLANPPDRFPRLPPP